jgi:signal transduction histidine kinase
LRVKKIWELLGEINQPGEREVYIVNQTGLIIAHANPTIALSQLSVKSPLPGPRAIGISGQETLVINRSLQLGEQELTIIVEQPVAKALELAISTLQVTIIIGAMTLVISVLLAILATRQIVRPVENLAAAARSIVDGNLSHRIEVTRQDEIADLELAFNLMGDQLSQIIGSLELRVAEGSQELQQTAKEIENLIAELEAKNAELEQFILIVSHDLKSPLVTIQGFAGYLKQEALAANKGHMLADLTRITEAADKMHGMLEDLLNLSRIGRVVNPSDEIPMQDLVQKAIEMVSGRLRNQSVKIVIAPGLPLVYGDLPRLREALENLVDNAVKYMGNQPHPMVKIGVRDVGDNPVFYVEDNGMGIEAAYHEKIFGMFEQLDPALEGNGMGLAITRRIIEQHGGHIWVESQGLGHGSTFCFTLPARQKSETQGDHERQTFSNLAG